MSRFTIEKPQPDTPGLITGTGSYHLDRRTYTADLKSENLKLLGLQLPGGETIRGDMQLAAKGMGSVDSPAGAADVTFDGLEVERPPSQVGAEVRSRRLERRGARGHAGRPCGRQRRRREQAKRRSRRRPSGSTSTPTRSSRWPDRGRRSSRCAPRISTSPRCPDCRRTVPTKGSFAPRLKRPAISSRQRREWRPRRSSRSWGPGTAGRSRS